MFDNVQVVDRRNKSSHGYRAVHLIVKSTDKAVEIQVRTKLQHLWAELSEKLADTWGQSLKYGKGDPDLMQVLAAASKLVEKHEEVERLATTIRMHLAELIRENSGTVESFQTIRDYEDKLISFEREKEKVSADVLSVLQETIDSLLKMGDDDVVSD
jgi:ppGpp synthetase/RelA/SpoT-type nucleotidyltranferase